MILPLQRHHFLAGDRVLRPDGIEGVVLETTALYALIRWADELRTWVDQHDPAVEVVERAPAAQTPALNPA